jgi:alpha-D-ribose 1-methylphosphonate 5-phosphate C-P lyase
MLKINHPSETSTETLTSHENQAVDQHFNFAYLDERTKRMIRRAILKAPSLVIKCPLVLAKCRCPTVGAPAAFK